MDESKISVRDKRKAETLSLIHQIAQRSVDKKGLVDTKIEDIADQAGVSRRTFFNYYATKEDAVLGFISPSLPDESIEKFMNSKHDILTRITWLVVQVIQTTTVPGSSGKMRKELRKRFPELTQRFEVRAALSEEIVRKALMNELHEKTTDLTKQDIDVILGLARVVIRYAYSLDSEIKDSSIKQSINIFKSTIRKIQ